MNRMLWREMENLLVLDIFPILKDGKMLGGHQTFFQLRKMGKRLASVTHHHTP